MHAVYTSDQIHRALIRRSFIDAIDRKVNRVFPKIDFLSSNSRFMKHLPNTKEAQTLIIEALSRPSTAIIRFGLYEYEACRQFLEKQNKLRNSYSNYIRRHIQYDAGMFTNTEKGIDCYAEIVLNNLKEVDGIAFWRNYPDMSVMNSFVNHPFLINMEDLYPYPFYHTDYLPDWQMKLKGKDVLFVTSFSTTIEQQYQKREQVWDQADDILPEFHLTTIKAPVTQGIFNPSDKREWIDVLYDTIERISAEKFDIALISCGSYGIPICCELKKIGKKAVQLGGCFQLWFGILGNRWDNDPQIVPYIKKSIWAYPSLEETPHGFEIINNGCYWNMRH